MLIYLTGFIYCLLKVADHWEYEFKAPDIDAMLTHRVEPEALKHAVEAELRAKNYDQARSLLALGQQYNHPLEYSVYEAYLAAHDTPFSRLSKQVSNFANGFVSGKGEDVSGVAGAVAADFTVVGDVRDLSEQYARHQQGLPVNQLVTTLAGIGVGLTAVTVSSMGATAPVKAGASTLKLATRMNRLSRSFRKELLQMTGRVFDWQQFVRLSKGVSLSQFPRIAKQVYNPRAAGQINALAKQANGIRKNTSISDSVHLLQYVDSSKDLNRLHRVTKRYGVQSRGVLRLLGKSAIRGVKALRITLELLISIVSSVFFALLFIVNLGGK